MAENRDTCLARKLHDLGIVHPNWTITLSRQYRIDLSTCASILLQESAGGRNVFGHDRYLKPTWLLDWLKGRKVTETRYSYYLGRRRAGHGMQGVGPLQLTWYEFQDAADRAGGCWRPYVNMATGFADLAAQIKTHDDLREGIKHYNGSGQAANDYATQVLNRRDKIHAVLHSCG